MAIDKFKFISPGIFINEIDESVIPDLPDRMGPVLLGRFKKGPSNRPIKVSSYNELVAQFGTPAPGTATGDIWRTGAMTAPTYAAYAAQAWLRNNTPCTVVRMLGVANENASTGAAATAGWQTDNALAEKPDGSGKVGGAYGLFVMPDPDSVGHGATTSSVELNFSLQADMNGLTMLAGVPAHLSGGVSATQMAPAGNELLTFDFKNAGAFADAAAADSIHVLTEDGQGDANLDTTMARLVNVINGSSAAVKDTDFKEGAKVNACSLAALTAAVTASWDSSNNRLKIESKVGGNLAQGITFTPSGGWLASNSAQTCVLGTSTTPSDATDGDINAIATSSASAVTGTLGAIWYVQDGWASLSGSLRADADQGSTTTSALIKSTDQKFVVEIRSGSSHGSNTLLKTAEFNFQPTSDQFVRKQYNTDPTLTNADLVDTSAGGVVEKYWLGETFEDNVRSEMKRDALINNVVTQVTASATGDFLGMVLALSSVPHGGGDDWSIRTANAAAASTGWFISNDARGSVSAGFDPTLDAHAKKLFKLVALDNGENVNREIKISIADIKAPSNQFIEYGTFSVLIRDAQDTDANPVILERYSNLNLDPMSPNYIARVIGDKQYQWDDASKTIRSFGSYENKSNWVRVEVSPYVDNGNAGGLLPYGGLGPVVMKGFQIRSGAGAVVGVTPSALLDDKGNALADASVWVCGGVGAPSASIDATNTGLTGDGEDTLLWDAGAPAVTASIVYPSSRIRDKSSDDGLVLQTSAFFGYQSNRKGSGGTGNRVYAPENLDHMRGAWDTMDVHAVSEGETEHCWIFTLDDLVVNSEGIATHTEGSRASGDSVTAGASGSSGILTKGFNRFTVPVFGGKDGLDITEKDPFRNRFLQTGNSATTNYAFNTIERNIDMIADPEFIEFDVAAVPGLTNETLTDKLIVACETRGDAIAVIDLSGSYEPPHEGNMGVSPATRTGSVDDVVANLKSRGLNSSYGCAFFPFVQVRDTTSDAILFVPPSVVAIGTFSSSQRKSAVWFAPAGFTRGGLSEGSAGIPVIGTRTRVTAAQRDKLYDANINPIATFPAEGVVIFGQKTLQVTPSALDRINVRRLLIFLKKEVSRIASTTLFEQNVQATWDKFTGQVNPFLESVKAGLGLTDFKVVLDKNTTTDDLIDRNILYAKIFLKPARAIEFIALDFIITRSGASFDD